MWFACVNNCCIKEAKKRFINNKALSFVWKNAKACRVCSRSWCPTWKAVLTRAERSGVRCENGMHAFSSTPNMMMWKKWRKSELSDRHRINWNYGRPRYGADSCQLFFFVNCTRKPISIALSASRNSLAKVNEFPQRILSPQGFTQSMIFEREARYQMGNRFLRQKT